METRQEKWGRTFHWRILTARNSSTGVAAGGVPGTHGEEQKLLASGQGPEGQFSAPAEATTHPLSPPCIQHPDRGERHIWASSNLDPYSFSKGGVICFSAEDTDTLRSEVIIKSRSQYLSPGLEIIDWVSFLLSCQTPKDHFYGSFIVIKKTAFFKKDVFLHACIA